MMISIIIACYNGEKYIKNCLNAVFASHYDDFEVIAIDDKLRAMIHANQSEAIMEEQARLFSKSMQADGFRKVLLGETTIEEVLRVAVE